MLLSLWLPIVLSAVALFFASFLSWMALQLHKNDWRKLAKEEEFLNAVRPLGLPAGSYMFPCAGSQAEMQSEEHRQKWAAGPRGIMTLFGNVNMGRNLALTFLYFLVFERLGFVIATTIYLIALMAYFHRNKWTSNVLTAVLFSVGAYLMFTKLLGVNLARGILPF